MRSGPFASGTEDPGSNPALGFKGKIIAVLLCLIVFIYIVCVYTCEKDHTIF
jgi:hypothetical protein